MSSVEKRENPTHIAPLEMSSSWPAMASQWVRDPAIETLENEVHARRQEALRRWRGLVPESPSRV